MDYGLKNKVVLVTGAADGCGKAIAKAFVAEGANVILHDLAFKEDMLKANVCELGDGCRYVTADLSVESEVEKMIAVTTFDGLFKLDENKTPQKCAVKDYKISNDGLTYTFELRDDMNYYISGDVEDFLEEKSTTINKNVIDCPTPEP